MFLKMFNENIDDLNDVIPSLAIMRLSFMLKDIYKHAKKPNLLNEVEMQKLYINYGDKYNAIDKVVLLIYGITSINNYKIDEEKIPISRVNIESLNEKEKALIKKAGYIVRENIDYSEEDYEKCASVICDYIMNHSKNEIPKIENEFSGILRKII